MILSNVPDSIIPASSDSAVDINRLKVERGREMQIFTYWFKIGDSFTPNYWKQQALIAYKSLLGLPASSALIRISSNVKNDNDTEAIGRIKKFGRLIIPHLKQYLP